MTPDPIIDAKAASALVGGTVSADTFRHWYSRGSAEGPQGWFKLGKRRLVIHRSAVEAWIAAQENRAA